MKIYVLNDRLKIFPSTRRKTILLGNVAQKTQLIL